MNHLSQLEGAALSLEGAVPWGDFDESLRDMETGLRLALEATASDLRRYEEELEDEVECRYGDEFSIPAAVVDEMGPEARLAYVARLVRTLANAYGVDCDSFPAWGHCPASLLRGLNDLSWTGVSDSKPRGSAD